ncbi:MAG: hypothetical protein ABEI52_03450, partial [Halobacteriaceae archaeon]
AMGYNESQIEDLERTIQRSDADLVIAGTPHDLSRQVDVDIPIERVHYRVEPHDWSFEGLMKRNAGALGLEASAFD